MWSYHYNEACYRLRSRQELAQPEHQHVLARAVRERGRCRCGCRDDIALWLIPVERVGGRYFLRRRRISDPHRRGCMAETLEPIFDGGGVIYSESIVDFDFGLASPAVGGAGEEAFGGSGCRYGDLVHFLQANFTRAQVEAFAAVNAGKSWRDAMLINPGREEVFLRFHRQLNLHLVDRGRRSLRELLEEKALTLIWGVTAQPLVEQSESPLAEDEILQLKVGRHWSIHGPQHQGALLEVPAQVANTARGNAKARRHVIGPPYLYVAVGRSVPGPFSVNLFYRVPVATAGGAIHIVKSEAERRSLNLLAAAGGAWLKPHVQPDLRVLQPNLWPPLSDDEPHRLPSRPDVILFVGGKITVLYLTASTDATYHAGVDRSVALMRDFLAGTVVRVLKLDAAAIDDRVLHELGHGCDEASLTSPITNTR